jgi:hypothetical protein
MTATQKTKKRNRQSSQLPPEQFDDDKDIRPQITRLFKAIEARKYRCACGGTLRAQVMHTGGCTPAFSEHVRLHCSRSSKCYRSSDWYSGFDLFEAFDDWKRTQRKGRRV